MDRQGQRWMELANDPHQQCSLPMLALYSWQLCGEMRQESGIIDYCQRRRKQLLLVGVAPVTGRSHMARRLCVAEVTCILCTEEMQPVLLLLRRKLGENCGSITYKHGQRFFGSSQQVWQGLAESCVHKNLSVVAKLVFCQCNTLCGCSVVEGSVYKRKLCRQFNSAWIKVRLIMMVNVKKFQTFVGLNYGHQLYG